MATPDPILWLALLNIIAVDIVLSGDNALVIALAVRRLPPELARKAAIAGAIGAVSLRVLFTALAAMLLAVPGLQALGGVTLLGVTAKLLLGDDDAGVETPIDGFWAAVKVIILADLVMSLDNMIAVGGAAHGNVALLLAGLAISIPLVLGGSAVIIKALTRWPWLSTLGAGVLAATATRMIAEDPMVHAAMGVNAPGAVMVAPWLGVAAVAGFALRGRVLPPVCNPSSSR